MLCGRSHCGPHGRADLCSRPPRRWPSSLDFLHLPCKVSRRKDSLLKEDVGESRDPALVVGELADHLGTKGLDPMASASPQGRKERFNTAEISPSLSFPGA